MAKIVDIPGYEGLYKISEYGNVFNAKGKELKQSKDRRGYFRVWLYKENKRKEKSIHRLVALSFIKKTNETVNHIDSNKENNHLSNLEWCSNKENIQHSFKNGRKDMSKKVWKTRRERTNGFHCGIQTQEKIIELFNTGLTRIKIAEIVGLNRHTVGSIISYYLI